MLVSGFIAKWFTYVSVWMYFRLFSIIVYCKTMNIFPYNAKCKSLSHVWLFAAPWIACQALLSVGRILGVGSHSLLQGIFPTEGSSLALLLADEFFTIWLTSFLCYTGKTLLLVYFMYSSVYLLTVYSYCNSTLPLNHKLVSYDDFIHTECGGLFS